MIRSVGLKLGALALLVGLAAPAMARPYYATCRPVHRVHYWHPGIWNHHHWYRHHR